MLQILRSSVGARAGVVAGAGVAKRGAVVGVEGPFILRRSGRADMIAVDVDAWISELEKPRIYKMRTMSLGAWLGSLAQTTVGPEDNT